MNNLFKKTKGISCALLFVLSGAAIACSPTDGDNSVKDNNTDKDDGSKAKAVSLYNSLKTIANKEYKKAKGIADDVDYIKGLAAASCESNSQMHDSDFCWTMYTDTDAIYVRLNITGDNEEDCVNFVNQNAINDNLTARVQVGEIYNDETFVNFVYNKYTNRTPKEKGSERYYLDANKPTKMLGFKVSDDEVIFSMTGTSGAGILFSTQGWPYSISQNTNTGTGNAGDEVLKDRIPVTYALITEYVKF